MSTAAVAPVRDSAFAAGVDTGRLAAADDVLDQLVSPAGRADPYPHYRELRDLAPLYRSGWDGLWYASRYDDGKAVLVDPRCGREPGQLMRVRHGMNPAMAERFRRRLRSTMLTENPPEHTRLRAPVSRAFTPRRVAGLAERITERLAVILDGMAEAGEVDLMAVLAFPLPVAVIGDLVGVPADEREQFRELVRLTREAAEPDAPPEVVAASEQASEAQEAYFADLVVRKRAAPGDDLLSDLIEQTDAGGPLSEEEMVATARLLFGAGFVTTTNLIGNAVLTLLRHPDQMGRLWSDPGLAAGAVDETLRYESIVQANARTVFEPMELGGQQLEAGDHVVVLVGGANRDPATYDDPETFDIGRRGEIPLSFGWGVHHCLGAPLARMEGQLVLSGLVERFSQLELAGPEPAWTGSFLRGVVSLPVRVRAR